MDVSRRSFLLGTAAASLLPRVAFASAAMERRFVVVVLRGAWDGLAAIPAYGDAAFAGARGSLDMGGPDEEGGILDLDGFFGMHPALEALVPFWNAGHLLPVHAVATTHRGRSHFEAQNVLEAGLPNATAISDGWLNRALLQLPQSKEQPLGMAIGHNIPLTLRGEARITSWTLGQMPGPPPELTAKIAALWREDPVLGPVLAEGFRTHAIASEILTDEIRPGRTRGANAFEVLAEAAGRLLASDNGPRIAVLEQGGWDTHTLQGTLRGRMAHNLTVLAGGLLAMAAALGPKWDQTAVLCVSDFGRTVAPNGTGGTDHGTGGLALLIGGAVKGGRVVTDWPGLDKTSLFEDRDLRPTTDIRSLYKSVLHDHLCLDRFIIDRHVLPDSGDARMLPGLIRT